nr:unnamed protein product [Spirometra erinaceieuropaei]
MSNNSTSQLIAENYAFDLPSAWLGDITLWLRVGESSFAFRQITREDTKCHYAVAALPMDIATDLRDIIDGPHTEAPYTALNEALASRISLSIQKCLQRLISEGRLGKRKPTQFLRRLEQPFPNSCPFCANILASNISSSTVQMIVETADRILEYYKPPGTVNVISRITAEPTTPTIENVMKRLDGLTLDVPQPRVSCVTRRRSPSISHRQTSPTAVSAPSTPDGFFWPPFPMG